jgi:hypothetical protein
MTHIVEVAVTPAPASNASGVDESVQPCPVMYWQRGRCVATAVQIEAYAQATGGK